MSKGTLFRKSPMFWSPVVAGAKSIKKSLKPEKMPPIKEPSPLPTEQPGALETEEQAKRRARKRRGWEKTLLTGELVPVTERKTTLG